MINKPKSLLYVAIGCLFFLSMPVAGFCESAYEQLKDAAGRQPGNVSGPGAPVCVKCGGKNGNHAKDCPYAKKESISSNAGNLAIAGMLAKQRSLERSWIEKIQQIDMALKRVDGRIASTTATISKAQMAGRSEAEATARQALNKYEQSKKSYLEQKRHAEKKLQQAEDKMKELSRALMDKSAPANVRGVVSQFSGEVSLLRANSGPNATSLTRSAVPTVGYLAPGDEIQTGKDSRAELQIVSGRGSMTMGENSKLKVEKDNGDAEVVRTLEGKFHFIVDKVEKFQADLETDLTALKDKLVKISDDPQAAYERFLKGMKAKVQKKLETRSRGGGTCSVRSTEFVVNENQDGSSEFVVIKGKVEVTEPNGGKSTIVETGQTVIISSSGKLSEVRQIDVSTLHPWWK